MTCQYPGCRAGEADEDIVCTEHRRIADEKRERASRIGRAGRAARAAAERAESAEPACWSWEPPTRTEDEVRAELAAEMSPGTVDLMLSSWPDYQFEAFHGGRCAICGRHSKGGLVVDHDHATGLVRGLLCRGCNVSEGMSRAPVFRAYRTRNPATILGFESPYYLWSGMDVVNDPPRDPWLDNPMRGLL